MHRDSWGIQTPNPIYPSALLSLILVQWDADPAGAHTPHGTSNQAMIILLEVPQQNLPNADVVQN